VIKKWHHIPYLAIFELVRNKIKPKRMAPQTKFTKHLHELKGILHNDETKSAVQHELIEETLAERLWGLFIEILTSVFAFLEIDPDALIDLMLQNDSFEKLFITFLAESIQTETTWKVA
jgi:hypothetical protein